MRLKRLESYRQFCLGMCLGVWETCLFAFLLIVSVVFYFLFKICFCKHTIGQLCFFWYGLPCCVIYALVWLSCKSPHKNHHKRLQSSSISGTIMERKCPSQITQRMRRIFAMFFVVFGANHYWPSWRRLNREIMILTSAGECDDDGGNYNRPSSTA